MKRVIEVRFCDECGTLKQKYDNMLSLTGFLQSVAGGDFCSKECVTKWLERQPHSDGYISYIETKEGRIIDLHKRVSEWEKKAIESWKLNDAVDAGAIG